MSNEWTCDLNRPKVKWFLKPGHDEMSLCAINENGKWNWSGSHIKYGEYWPMEQEELKEHRKNVLEKFLDIFK